MNNYPQVLLLTPSNKHKLRNLTVQIVYFITNWRHCNLLIIIAGNKNINLIRQYSHCRFKFWKIVNGRYRIVRLNKSLNNSKPKTQKPTKQSPYYKLKSQSTNHVNQKQKMSPIRNFRSNNNLPSSKLSTKLLWCNTRNFKPN